jgi:hypothetical protein
MGSWRRLKHAAVLAAMVLAMAAVRLEAAGQDDGPTLACLPDADENVSAADAIQACIDRAPALAIVELPAGNYVLRHQIVVSTAVTLRTANVGSVSSCLDAPDTCAVLVAAPDLADQWGMLVVRSAAHVRLEYFVLDGNRAQRTDSPAARFCVNGDTAYGFNASVLECEACGLEGVVSRNALCGTGLVWTGAGATIEHSAFVSNGDAATRSMWADGLTLLYAPRSSIRENTFANNSDVALIVGFGVDARVERNVIVQRTQPSFAGLMLDNFNSNDRSMRGDFRGGVIANNTIDCGPQLCTFGIQVGPRPWYPTNNIVGGEVHDNIVKGAKIGINVDGAGERDIPTAVFGNMVEPALSGSYFAGCAHPIPAEWMNIAPTSFVDRRNEETTTGSHLSDSCQLWSNLSTDR